MGSSDHSVDDTERGEDVGPPLRRFGQVLRLKPELAERYIELHANQWPEVDAAIRAANITSYSIYEFEGYLFAYIEYRGTDWEADTETMASNPKVQEWWALNDPCLQRLDGTSGTQLWQDMEEIYHLG